jgi:hypothetical protein
MYTHLTKLALLAACCSSLPNNCPAQSPHRHLFLDPTVLDEAENATLCVNPAQRREVVIRPDRPWEQLMISFYLTVLDEGDKLRMWYICRDSDNRPNVAYAESLDGATWVKPSLGIVDYHGSKDNNLVGLSSLEGVVFPDPNGKPEEKYVYVTHVSGEGVVRFYSPDGLHWQRDRERLLQFRPDTQNVTLWDERLGCYVLYLRGWDVSESWELRLRKVVRLTLETLSSPAGITPSGAGRDPNNPKSLLRVVDEMPTVFAADDRDPPNSDVYNIAAQLYPLDRRWYVGFPSFLLRERNISDGRLEVHFIGSSDGVHWHRYDRRPYATPGLQGSESGNMVFMGTGMVVRGDEIWQYGTGFHSRHGDMDARRRKTDGVIYRYAQRVDGFVSLDFGLLGGTCVTAPVKADGERLLVNVDTGALGDLRVGLADADGKPIPGFSVDECDVIRTNSTAAVVSWQAGDDLSAIEGREVRLAFAGSRAKLYGFYFNRRK